MSRRAAISCWNDRACLCFGPPLPFAKFRLPLQLASVASSGEVEMSGHESALISDAMSLRVIPTNIHDPMTSHRLMQLLFGGTVLKWNPRSVSTYSINIDSFFTARNSISQFMDVRLFRFFLIREVRRIINEMSIKFLMERIYHAPLGSDEKQKFKAKCLIKLLTAWNAPALSRLNCWQRFVI